MKKQLGYQAEPDRLEFDTVILQKTSLPNNHFSLILDQTFFYPTGGGQEYDTGLIANAKVVNVFKHPQEPFLIHEVDQDVPEGPIHASIDGDRRMRHMQNHSAQHLLTHCIFHLSGYETVSANINGYAPSTLDLDAPQIKNELLFESENLANSIIFDNRPVKIHFVSPNQVHLYPIRKKPAHHEQVRIVEIDGFDFSACGGTHVSQTGSIGTIKITKAERVNRKTRIHFCAGWTALNLFQNTYKSINELALRLSIQPTEIPDTYLRLEEQVTNYRQLVEKAQSTILDYEANALIQKADYCQGNKRSIKLVSAEFHGRNIVELRSLTDRLRNQSRSAVFLSTWEDEKVAIFFACASDTHLSANSILSKILYSFNGRGGGDDQIAQGGGRISFQEYQNLPNFVRKILAEEVQSDYANI
jgi:alanyl-tRNA synthetase